MASGCSSTADQAFGPGIGGDCRGGFDFTLLFEQSILAIGPSSLLLLLVPPRVYTLYASSARVLRSSRPDLLKVSLSVVLAGLQLALVILWAANPSLSTVASIPAAVLALVDAVAIYHLSYVEHVRSVQPSTLLLLYLFLSLLLDIPQARTLFLQRYNAIGGIFVVAMAIKLLLLIVEGMSKTKLLALKYKDYPPETTSGIFSRTFLWWVNPLFVIGFKGLFGLKDLFNLDPAMSSEMLGERAQKAWESRKRPEHKLALVLACAKALWWPLFLIIPPRLCLIGFNYAQPFLISVLISYLSQPQGPQTYNDGLGLIAATAIIYTGVAVFTVIYMHALYRMITMLRGVLTRLIFNKALKARDGVYDESAAVTLMSTDIDRIALSVQNMNEVWARTVEIAVGVWLLAVNLGWVAVLPIAIIAALNTWTSSFISNKQKVWNGAVQKRIAATSSALGSMKSIKMMGLTTVLSTLIQKLRIDELNSAMGYRWLVVLTNMVAYTPLIFAPVLTFTAFAAQSTSVLSTNKALTSLSIITLVTQPATQLLTAITESAACLGCFTRIQNYLLAASFEDARQMSSDSTLVFSGHEKGDGSSKESSKESSSIERQETTFLEKGPALSPRISGAVDVEISTLRPAPGSQFAVTGLEFHLKCGELAVLMGPVGSGKSTILRAILSELQPEHGTVSISDRRIAFCAQDPWIMNISLQQTITGFAMDSAIDEQWYKDVIHACALAEDFAMFPEGDQSVPGSKGLTLSGGQKQRLALARAIYSRTKIVVLDDVLSALDAKTEAHVNENLLGTNGILRKLNSTVVLATHSPRPMAFADRVIVLSADGTVLTNGPPVDGRVADANAQEAEAIAAASEGKQRDPAKPKKQPAVKKPSANDVDDLTRRTGDMAVYHYYFKSLGLWPFIGFVAVTVIYVVATYFPQVWLKWWSESDGTQFGKYVSVYVVLAVVAWVFRAVTLWWMLVYISPASSAKLHLTMLKTAMNAPQSFFAKTDTGPIVNRFSQDIGLIDRNLPLSTGRVLTQFCTILAQAALISQGSAFMAVTIPFLLGAVYVLQKIYLLTSRQLRFLDLEGRSPVYTNFLETLAGTPTIRALGWQKDFERINIKRLDQSQRPYYLLYTIQRWLNMVLDLIVAAMAVIVVALALRVTSSSSPGAIGLALNNILGFSQALRVMVDAWTQLETSLGGIARLKNFEQTVLPEHLPFETRDPGPDWPKDGNVEFKNLYASYNDSTQVLKNINISVPAGQKLGICGRTGSGKSSLLLALLRLLELDRGTILVDGVDLQTVPRNLVRERLGTIPQDPFLLAGSVRANLDPLGRFPGDDAPLVAALEKVQIWGLIKGRGGLDASAQDQPLSQGQQQLFALARALVHRARVLVLDEATSNVDAESDRLMQRVIREEFQGRTIITVAHRLDTIIDSDIVVVLEAGEVREMGKPSELLERESKFRELYNNKGAVE